MKDGPYKDKIALNGFYPALAPSECSGFLRRSGWLYEPVFEFWQRNESRLRYEEGDDDDGGRYFVMRYALEVGLSQVEAYNVVSKSIELANQFAVPPELIGEGTEADEAREAVQIFISNLRDSRPRSREDDERRAAHNRRVKMSEP